jgi:ADP-ribose pyrophosphatase YjhB (NUDIX family)
MKPFDFCPSCAARLAAPGDDGKLHCPSCGRDWYLCSAPTTGAAIVETGRVLVTERARAPYKGKYDVPGGFLEPGEEPIDGLRREVREELGVEIESSVEDCVSMVLHTYGPEGDYVLALGFKAKLISGDPRPADDVAAFKWVTEDELDELDFAWPHDRELLRRALKDAAG